MSLIEATGPNAILEAEIATLRLQLKAFELIEERDNLANCLAQHIRKQQEQKRMTEHFRKEK